MSEKEPIGVVGAGWVGLVTAACFAELGHRVVVREIVPEKVVSLSRGEVPIHEPGLPELIERNRERLEQEIGNFEIIEHDGTILACAALYPYPEEKSAELACLAVSPEYRDAGYGERLLLACEVRAKEAKIRRIFALTTRAQHWFIAQGFKEAGVAVLPEKRQALYNWKRGSKIFLKRL